MAGQDEGWTRIDWARWFLDHDEVDEAARVLQPGDQLALGRSDYLDLAAALSRRGLRSSYEDRQAHIKEGAGQASRGDTLTGDLAASDRKPPARGTPVFERSVKKTG